jgi:hypothetical protein
MSSPFGPVIGVRSRADCSSARSVRRVAFTALRLASQASHADSVRALTPGSVDGRRRRSQPSRWLCTHRIPARRCVDVGLHRPAQYRKRSRCGAGLRAECLGSGVTVLHWSRLKPVDAVEVMSEAVEVLAVGCLYEDDDVVLERPDPAGSVDSGDCAAASKIVVVRIREDNGVARLVGGGYYCCCFHALIISTGRHGPSSTDRRFVLAVVAGRSTGTQKAPPVAQGERLRAALNVPRRGILSPFAKSRKVRTRDRRRASPSTSQRCRQRPRRQCRTRHPP